MGKCSQLHAQEFEVPTGKQLDVLGPCPLRNPQQRIWRTNHETDCSVNRQKKFTNWRKCQNNEISPPSADALESNFPNTLSIKHKIITNLKHFLSDPRVASYLSGSVRISKGIPPQWLVERGPLQQREETVGSIFAVRMRDWPTLHLVTLNDRSPYGFQLASTVN